MTSLAEAECRRSGWSFGDTFRNQYVITRKAENPPPGWQTLTLGKWRVGHCPELPHCALTLSDGSVAGAVLGYAISPDGLMLDGTHKMPITARAKDPLGKAEDYIAKLAGRYVVLLVLDGAARVYADPVCGLGPVYNATARRAGASTALVVDRALLDNPEVPATAVAQGSARYLFGHTADAEVRRAVPNHYLDLDTFALHRHWPTAAMPFELGDRDRREVSAEIAAKLGANMKALCDRHTTALPITGGTDSRLLLAAAREFLDEVGQLFVYRTNWANSFDAAIALEIAETMCVPLRVISSGSPLVRSALEGEAFDIHMAQRLLRSGMEPDRSDPGSVRALQLMPRDTIILRGNVAEMTRALRWHRSVFDDPHNTAFALAKLELRKETVGDRYGYWEAQFLNWKRQLPENALPRIYDLLHVELWLPHAHSTAYIRDLRHFPVNPFNDRHLIHLTAMIPPFLRKKRRVVNDIVNGNAAEIGGIDYKVERVRAAKQSA